MDTDISRFSAEERLANQRLHHNRLLCSSGDEVMTENILTLGDLLLGVHENMGSGYSYAAVDLYAQL